MSRFGDEKLADTRKLPGAGDISIGPTWLEDQPISECRIDSAVDAHFIPLRPFCHGFPVFLPNLPSTAVGQEDDDSGSGSCLNPELLAMNGLRNCKTTHAGEDEADRECAMHTIQDGPHA